MNNLVAYQLEDSVATIAMDDGKVNALSPRMFEELGAALDRAAADRATVLLTGRPGIFSAGFDLTVLRAGGPDAQTMIRSGFALAERLLSFPAPTVVACTGHAVAMGFFLLQSADYRIGAAGPFRLNANEVAIRLTMPWTGVEICRQRLAPAVFQRALILAEAFAPDATAIHGGILDRVVEAGELQGVARGAARAMAGLDLHAHAATKLRVRDQALRAIRAAIEQDGAGWGAEASARVV
jgi:enoyl-CoA hydratase